MAKQKPSLNKADINQLKSVFATKTDLQKTEQRFQTWFTQYKSEFFEKIDPILKEVLASREERTIIAHHISDLRVRVEKIEKHLGISTQ